MAPVYHLILVKYKAGLSTEEKTRIARACVALGQQCKHERDGQPYFTVVGGSNNSKEGLSGPTEHAFVMTFRSNEDRDYYVHQDPTRAKFRAEIIDSLDELRIADFEENVFA
ncbi:hypothetical protein JCM10908_006343 [Rhodotorula pacifica]|uniref:Dabb family protein n=1 Tax=Rhodotorula pacifica TaxID=1495444 RepID=UPI0031772331